MKRFRTIQILLISIVLLLVVLLTVIYQTGNFKPKSKHVPQSMYPSPGIDKSVLYPESYPAFNTAPNSLTDSSITVNQSVKSNAPTKLDILTISDVQRISASDAKLAFDDKKAIFVDVRSSESYKNARIPGAISIPEADIMSRMDELKKDFWIILYCS